MSDNTDLRLGKKYGIWTIIEATGKRTKWGENVYKAVNEHEEERLVWWSHIKHRGLGHPVRMLRNCVNNEVDVSAQDKSKTGADRKELFTGAKVAEGQIIKTSVVRGRFHVHLQLEDGSKKTMPKAKHVWLKGNPSFSDIPKGYVIHHLDEDRLNDDITNLVIMYKHHHVSYHWKQKSVDSPVEIGDVHESSKKRTLFFPTKEPRITEKPGRKRWQLGFMEKLDGESRMIRLFSFKGRPFKTREDAEWAKVQIWQPPENTRRCPSCDGKGYVPEDEGA